jgi:UDP-N-acetylmuramate--alanine ligase
VRLGKLGPDRARGKWLVLSVLFIATAVAYGAWIGGQTSKLFGLFTGGVEHLAVAAGFGVKRRFSRAGDWQGVAVYDDYAHHPVEIAAVLRAARMAGSGRILAVLQPHRYTRLQSLFNEFSACLDDADIVVVTPVYSAGEAPIPGIDRDELAASLRRHGHPQVMTVEDEQGLVETIASIAKSGDLVVGLGAGTITDWINALPSRLASEGRT